MLDFKFLSPYFIYQTKFGFCLIYLYFGSVSFGAPFLPLFSPFLCMFSHVPFACACDLFPACFLLCFVLRLWPNSDPQGGVRLVQHLFWSLWPHLHAAADRCGSGHLLGLPQERLCDTKGTCSSTNLHTHVFGRIAFRTRGDYGGGCWIPFLSCLLVCFRIPSTSKVSWWKASPKHRPPGAPEQCTGADRADWEDQKTQGVGL